MQQIKTSFYSELKVQYQQTKMKLLFTFLCQISLYFTVNKYLISICDILYQFKIHKYPIYFWKRNISVNNISSILWNNCVQISRGLKQSNVVNRLFSIFKYLYIRIDWFETVDCKFFRTFCSTPLGQAKDLYALWRVIEIFDTLWIKQSKFYCFKQYSFW